jgi:hypothetical protein
MDRLDSMDWGAKRLVPLVAWRLRESVDDQSLAPLRAELAASMLASRAQLPRFGAVLSALRGAGIDALVLKGVGIAALAYPDPGTRPMSDLDVLVRAEQLAELDEFVECHGGYTSHDHLDRTTRIRYRHAAGARIDEELVDIHWRLLVDGYDGRPDAALFDQPREITVGAVRARTLAAEDHLVHAVAHGVRRNSLAPVRWIADVGRLVQCQVIDWSRVEESSVRRNIAGVVGRGLGFVRERYGVQVPEETLRQLRRASGVTRGAPDIWSRSPKRTRFAGAVNVGLVHYVLASRGWSPTERLVRYPGYLRSRSTAGGDDVSPPPHPHRGYA